MILLAFPPSCPPPTPQMSGIVGSYSFIFPSPHYSSTGQARYTQQQYSTNMFPPYPSPISPISGVASPHFSSTGQAHQNVPQPTQQYCTTMSPSSYSLAAAEMPGIGQSLHTIQQQTGQYYPMSRSPLPAVDMVSHSMPQSSTISPNDEDDEFTASGCHDHFRSRSHPGQTGLPDSSTSANLGDSSFTPPGRTHVANSRIGDTVTHPFGVAADPSNHVTNMPMEAAAYSSGVSNGSEAASVQYFSTYTNQSNDAMIDSTARPKSPTAELTRNGVIPMVPENAPGPQNTYTHPPTTNLNQYTGYSSHNPPSLHSSQYRNTATGDNFPPSSSLQMHHLPQYVSPNTNLAPPPSYLRSFAHDFGTQYGSQSAGPSYQPAPSMAPSSSIHLQQDPPRRNAHSHPSSGRRRTTRAQDTDPSSSITFSCGWRGEDDTPCPFQGSLDELRRHLTRNHLSGAQNASVRCHWQGCLHDMRRDSVWRHVRETHLKLKRGT